MHSIEQLAVNTIRTLSMDAVQKANSGHPGTPMALAPVAYQLWRQGFCFSPDHPTWPGRDRFVLSCGHASMLLYSMLHLTGVKKIDGGSALAISLEDIQNFRQLHSPCAGHPEYGEAAGVETTTGPLGQGVGNSVGMAIASQWFHARYAKSGFDLFRFNVFAFCSDGDLMEGISSEAASLAGHLKLSNLCWVYDDNGITIEGSTDLAFSENVGTRFEALGWRTCHVSDANDLQQIRMAFDTFLSTNDRPTLIIVKSVIAYGSPNKHNTAAAHGAPLGEDEVRLAKRAYGWPEDSKFLVPEEVKRHFAETFAARGNSAEAQWRKSFEEYERQYPTLADELKMIWSGRLPDEWDKSLDSVDTAGKANATRAWSGKVLNAVAPKIPWMIGGSADLAESNKSLIEGTGDFSKFDYGGRNFHFGVREHAMAAIANGLSLCGIRPYCATFFIFTDYFRPSMRLAALMRRPVIYLLTHDSIGLGEDGPTHQPIEHLAACRAMPNLVVFRPADGGETVEAYRVAIQTNHRPTAIILSRQSVPTLDRTRFQSATGARRGAYILWQPEPEFDVILIGTGSEVSLCLAAGEQLLERGIRPRVVSMPCWELFDEQPREYRDSVLPPHCIARVAAEAGVELGWQKYLGPDGRFVGLKGFGASAPYQALYREFGLTAEAILLATHELLASVTT